MSKIFPSYVKPHTAFPGGYSIIYLDENAGDTLCAKCAGTLHSAEPKLELTGFIHWEGETLQCAECNKNLPSEYGDPEVES